MPELDLCGKSVTRSLKKLEDVERRYPQIDFSNLKDIANLEEFVERVSLWDPPFAPEVVAHSKFSWCRSMNGAYVLTLPNRERATITSNVLGKFSVAVTVNGKTRTGDVDSLEKAFQAADRVVEREARHSLTLLYRDRRWHQDAATPEQFKTLRRLYKDRLVPADLSKGEASRLIGQFFANKAHGNTVEVPCP